MQASYRNTPGHNPSDVPAGTPAGMPPVGAREYHRIIHPHPPVWDARAEVLILGSFPSVKSRETGFYYGHPQNRFWRVMARVLAWPLPQSIQEKKHMLLENHIALWDVVAECDICGSSDSSIRNVRPNPVRPLLQETHIQHIFVNGATSERLYNTYLREELQKTAIRLPSTSPANAAWRLDALCEAWCVVREALSLDEPPRPEDGNTGGSEVQ